VSYALTAILISVTLFLVMLASVDIGRRVGTRHAARDPEKWSAGLGTVEGAVFGLMGLLVAFTFSGAASRFDTRRHLIVEETNDIGTAYLRLDLLPPGAQPVLRDLFRRYLDSRLETYRKLPDIAAAAEELSKSVRLQNEIWTQSVSACSAASPQCTMLLLPALNAMIDITTTRTMAAQMHPASIIFVLLFGLAVASALLAGYGMAQSQERSWLHMCAFALTIALAVYVILDIEYPRLGLIRVDDFDQGLVDLRNSIN